MHRRKFIRDASLATAGLTNLNFPVLGKNAPSNKVVLGVMGLNGRGSYLANCYSQLPNVEIAYICDVEEGAIKKGFEALKDAPKKPELVHDIRKLVEKKDFDALVVAAPDHWHTPAAILGASHGKHVYVEKPCGQNPHEGELVSQALHKYGKHIQMGNQRRSMPTLIEAVKQVREGAIGDAYFAKAWYTNNRQSIGIGKQIPVPSTLDFELWQGPAPRKPYQDNLVHYNWHWFWNWGTGEALNNGTHELDVIRWGLGVDFPNKVVSTGGRFHFKDDWQTPDTQNILYNFPNDTAAEWEGRSCNGYNIEGLGRGVIFYGDKGTEFFTGGNGYNIYDGDSKFVREVKDEVPVDATNKVSPTEALDGLHMKNFIESVQGKTKLNCPIEIGFKSTLLPQLGNISYRVDRVLHIDPTNGHILNDPE